jgi:hypothetical protein
MEALIKALEELNVLIEEVLENHEGTLKEAVKEEKPKKEKKEKKPKKEKKEGSVKNGIPVVRFIAPDGKKIQVNFDDTSPSMTIVPTQILE